jgi:hypothetical protein
MSASRAFQKAVVARLKADATVASQVGARIYDIEPAEAVYPYITLGDMDTVSDDEEGIAGRVTTLQIDIWCRDNGLRHPCRAIVDAVYAAFHEVTLDLEMPWANVETNVFLARDVRDPDGLTTHGIVQVSAMIEREI